MRPRRQRRRRTACVSERLLVVSEPRLRLQYLPDGDRNRKVPRSRAFPRRCPTRFQNYWSRARVLKWWESSIAGIAVRKRCSELLDLPVQAYLREAGKRFEPVEWPRTRH